MNISRLIKYLEHIQKTYGDLNLSGYDLGENEYIDLIGMFVETDKNELVFEYEHDLKDLAFFDVYEYPSRKEININ